MRPLLTFLLATSCVALSVSTAAAVMVTLPSVASGFIHDPMGGGDPNADFELGVTIQNYQAGYNKTTDKSTENWFIFGLPPLAPGEMIVAATLSLYLPIFPGDAGFGYGSEDPTEDFAVYGVGSAAITPAKILDDDTFPSDGPEFDLWYPAVVDGPELGSVTVAKSDEGGPVLLPFGPAGIAELMASLGGDFLMGGAVTTIGSPPIDDKAEALFHHTHPYGIAGPMTPEPMLILEIIPEPGSVALMLPACTLLLRRKRR